MSSLVYGKFCIQLFFAVDFSRIIYHYQVPILVSLYKYIFSSLLIVSNLSGSFTLLFSYMAGIEAITYGKILGLLVCLAGVALVSYTASHV